MAIRLLRRGDHYSIGSDGAVCSDKSFLVDSGVVEMTKQILDRDEFRAWLVAQNTTAVVGRYGLPRFCPLACYLQKAKDKPRAAVDGEQYRAEYDWKPLPKWAQDFVSALDLTGMMEGVPIGSVTAATALAILDSVAI